MSAKNRASALAFALPFLIALPAASPAQNRLAPVPVYSDSFPVARDLPYPGTIQLEVDATDIARSIFKVREVVPVVQPGRMTL